MCIRDRQGAIDVPRLAADRDQLWAEAARLEAQGVSDVLPRELWQMAAERAADQTSEDPWGDKLRTFLAGGTDMNGKQTPPRDRVHTSELFQVLGIAAEQQTKEKSQRIRTVMEAVLGWHHKRGIRIGDKSVAGYTREP